MRRRFWFWILALFFPLAAAGCGERSGGESRSRTMELLTTSVVNEPEQPRTGPQIAYSYDIAYQLRAAEIAAVQERQLALCRSLGPQRCLVLKSNTAGGDDGNVRGEASLVVDARLATSFTRRIDAIAAQADGTVADRSVTAVDVTKQVIDIDASVRAKEALASRLLTLVQTARGNVGELVAAEKAYADTQAELMSARARQAELRRQVAMSRLDIHYTSTEAVGAFAPVSSAIAASGTTLGESLRVLITAIVALSPWVLLFVVSRWLGRRLGWRGPLTRLREWRGRRRPAD